jgi:hypothetical protein
MVDRELDDTPQGVSAQDADPAPTSEAPAATNGNKRGGSPHRGQYVVLARMSEDGGFTPQGQYPAKSREEAMRIALGQLPALAEQVEAGAAVVLAAVPAASWSPVPVKVERPAPRVRLGG